MKLTKVADDGDVVRLRCEGEIRDIRAQIVADPLEQTVGAGCYARKVLLDLESSDYIDSGGIGWLVGAHKHFKSAGGLLVLHGIPPRVYQVLQFLHLQKVLNLAADESAARALVGGARG